MSKFTDKVKAFLKDVEGDAVGAEQHVVAWFHNIFASHTAGTPIPPPAQAGATPPPAVVAPAPPASTAYVNPNPPVTHPPTNPSPTAPVQAGSVAPTPNPPPVVNPVPVAAVPGGTVAPTLVDAPDAKGLVAFTGLLSTNAFSGVRVAVQEVGLSLPTGSQQRETCMNAVRVANDKYNVQGAGFIGVATDSVEVDNAIAGTKAWATASPAVNIPNSLAMPALNITDDGQSFDGSTVAGVGAYLLYQGAKEQRAPVVDSAFGGDGRAKAVAEARREAKASDTIEANSEKIHESAPPTTANNLRA